MPGESTIDYETLTQDAMRGVVRMVLTQAAKTGLPGDHHFYISFDTGASGVVLSKRLKDKYPSEMTIVLQHRFWDLAVNDDGFEVKLTFDGIPERLVVPYAAIRVFFDPSVRYGMQFDEPGAGDPDAGDIGQRITGRATDRAAGARAPLRSTAPKKPRVPRKPKADQQTAAPSAAEPAPAASPAQPTPLRAQPSSPAPQAPVAASKTDHDKPKQDNGGAQIVRLDAFRKK
jgi:hypothetical protein